MFGDPQSRGAVQRGWTFSQTRKHAAPLGTLREVAYGFHVLQEESLPPILLCDQGSWTFSRMAIAQRK